MKEERKKEEKKGIKQIYRLNWTVDWLSLWIWSIFACLIAMDVIKASLSAWFQLSVYKNRFGTLWDIFFKDVLNLGFNNGRYEPSLGWTKNSLKHEKFERSDRTDCGFSISTWIFRSPQEISEIYFSSQIDRTALTAF